VIAFLLIIYTAAVLLLFKVMHLRPRPYLIAGIIVAGILMLGGIVVAWTQTAPMTENLVTSQYVVQLVPYVKGQVKTVYAQANTPMRKGDVLLEIDPAPYQYAVDQLEAQLQKSKASIDEAQAGAQAADANVTKAKAEVGQAQDALNEAKAATANAQAALAKEIAADDLAKTREQMFLTVRKLGADAISRLRVDEAIQQRLEADAAVRQAEEGLKQAQAAEQESRSALAAAQAVMRQAEAAALQAQFAVAVAKSAVPGVEAQLDDARFNLAQCRIRAPADGYVVNWQVQVGTMLVPSPAAAAGTFIETSSTNVAAVFSQNYLGNVRPGDDVELVLDPYPGRLFTGKVDSVIAASGGGQFITTGTIPTTAKVGSTGAYAVRINFSDEATARNLAMGSGGAAAIYTKVGKPFHIISKVAIRMKKWLLYVMPSSTGV
jgi:membrane fusion protein (multidrug efflux system)